MAQRADSTVLSFVRGVWQVFAQASNRLLTGFKTVVQAGGMLPVHAQPLNQADLHTLDRFLCSAVCGREAMGLSRAHGFLTAIASGPEQMEPGEWLRLVFDEPVFENGEQADWMLGLAMRLYQEIETSLNVPGGFRPVLDFVENARGNVAVDALSWCQGYFSGMSLCREQWAWHVSLELGALLNPITQLARNRTPSGSALYQQQCDELPGAAEAVYRYWRAQSADAS